jgi:multiple sugar transport system permease protein/sn-glycerol 3-phosphate transport system permease protein
MHFRATFSSQKHGRWRHWLTGYLFILPALLIVAVFSFYPILYSLQLSFYDWNLIAPEPTFVGLRNFERLLTSSDFWHVIRNTLLFSGGTVLLTLIVPLLLALLLDNKLRGMAFFRALFFIPHLTPIAAIATLWFFLLDPRQGLINSGLEQIGIQGPPWLQSTTWSLPALILMKLWKSAGYYTVLFLAGLQNIPNDLYDAAKVDGANLIQRLRYITLPLLSPMTLFVLVIAIISSFQDFDLIAVMTRGGPVNSTNILVYYLYEQAFQRYRFGMGSAIAVIMLFLMMGFTLLQLWLSRRWVNY